jgi:hypothetical protein
MPKIGEASFKLFFFHLPYITRQHHTHSNRKTLQQRSPDTHKLKSRPRPRCTCARIGTARAVLALGAHVSFTLARASPELVLLNLYRILQNAVGSGEEAYEFMTRDSGKNASERQTIEKA